MKFLSTAAAAAAAVLTVGLLAHPAGASPLHNQQPLLPVPVEDSIHRDVQTNLQEEEPRKLKGRFLHISGELPKKSPPRCDFSPLVRAS